MGESAVLTMGIGMFAEMEEKGPTETSDSRTLQESPMTAAAIRRNDWRPPKGEASLVRFLKNSAKMKVRFA